MTVEFSTGVRGEAPLRSLARASGKSLDEVLELARKGELRQLFAGGRTFVIDRPGPEEEISALSPWRLQQMADRDPRAALRTLERKR